MSKTFAKEEVASHSKGDSLWIIIDEDVYDLTKFQDEHPGMSYTSLFPMATMRGY
jgi:cytochrome b involved in lipid metabolism